MDALRTYFQRELPGINALLDAETAKLGGLVRDVARHAILGGGKRIRPVLTLLCARALGREPGGELPLACALEMLHSATLLHD
ncbi:MAG: polyprenyl synthetase family protein, partial [Desulfovibrionaceae bacterium]